MALEPCLLRVSNAEPTSTSAGNALLSLFAAVGLKQLMSRLARHLPLCQGVSAAPILLTSTLLSMPSAPMTVMPTMMSA